ncbi:YheU family protein [Motiliproteus sp. SC1-56]|uniref:YheU family protein n=1 Tax=Motiliproteus sp. SC1-56 TaxID=2799565 RepID=UPI001A8FD4EA|nr:YheU family protein [Motiliproteus sp. SC1-56]
MRIPPDQLSAEALIGVIEEFVTRDGTDYGAVECSLEEKTEQVRRQLERGEAVLYFDTYLECCTILSMDDYRERLREAR